MTEVNTPVADLTQVIPADFGGLSAKYQHALRCNDAEERYSGPKKLDHDFESNPW